MKDDTSDALASPEALRAYLTPILDYLYTARPTAVNLGTAIKRLRAVLLDSSDSNNQNVRSTIEKLVAVGHLIADEDVGRNKEMSRYGAEWLLSTFEKTSDQLEEGGKVNVYV